MVDAETAAKAWHNANMVVDGTQTAALLFSEYICLVSTNDPPHVPFDSQRAWQSLRDPGRPLWRNPNEAHPSAKWLTLVSRPS